MNKEVQTRAEDQFDVSAWDYEIEVVKTRAAWERWKGITLTWRSATVELGRYLWMAHKVLGGDHKPGRKKNVSVRQKNVSVEHSISDFIGQIGMPKATFYRFVKRIDTMVEEGVPIQELSGDMKLVEAAALILLDQVRARPRLLHSAIYKQVSPPLLLARRISFPSVGSDRVTTSPTDTPFLKSFVIRMIFKLSMFPPDLLPARYKTYLCPPA